jgi:hypothetical protein
MVATKTQLVEAIDKAILKIAEAVSNDQSLGPGAVGNRVRRMSQGISDLVYARQALLRTYPTPLDIGLLKDSE